MMATTAALTSAQVSGVIMCLEVMYTNYQADYDNVDPLMAYKATSDPDTMYLHQEAMAQPDKKERVYRGHAEGAEQSIREWELHCHPPVRNARKTHPTTYGWADDQEEGHHDPSGEEAQIDKHRQLATRREPD